MRGQFKGWGRLGFRMGMVIAVFLAWAALAAAHPPVTLLDENGNPVVAGLNPADKIDFGNGKVYVAGPPYSPKQTCGKCHNYDEITKAFHFREGVGETGELLSDTWSSDHQNDRNYKYLANAYGHLLSPGQFGAW
ncbi:MAG: hypothetical protein DSZ24_07250 [Thermodesulfatator sp.]|nr:MAG: hypothetical protein DSZ24_07250 [Thermodesulfatator sp.]